MIHIHLEFEQKNLNFIQLPIIYHIKWLTMVWLFCRPEARCAMSDSNFLAPEQRYNKKECKAVEKFEKPSSIKADSWKIPLMSFAILNETFPKDKMASKVKIINQRLAYIHQQCKDKDFTTRASSAWILTEYKKVYSKLRLETKIKSKMPGNTLDYWFAHIPYLFEYKSHFFVPKYCQKSQVRLIHEYMKCIVCNTKFFWDIFMLFLSTLSLFIWSHYLSPIHMSHITLHHLPPSWNVPEVNWDCLRTVTAVMTSMFFNLCNVTAMNE